MKYLVIILYIIFFFSCKEHSGINLKNNELQSKTTNLDVSNETKTASDTINVNENAINKWSFSNETIFLFPSDKSDEYYDYEHLEIENIKSGDFIRIPKANSPYTGFEKIEIKFPYFTVEQSYREGDFTNYEYITFKKEGKIIYLDKYAVDFTNIHNLEEEIEGLRLGQKSIGKIQMKNVTSELLYSLRNKK